MSTDRVCLFLALYSVRNARRAEPKPGNLHDAGGPVAADARQAKGGSD
jgi:hypothetical protein